MPEKWRTKTRNSSSYGTVHKQLTQRDEARIAALEDEIDKI